MAREGGALLGRDRPAAPERPGGPVVVEDDLPLGRDPGVTLQPGSAELTRPPEGVEGVLAAFGSSAPMGKPDGRSGTRHGERHAAMVVDRLVKWARPLQVTSRPGPTLAARPARRPGPQPARSVAAARGAVPVGGRA